MPMEINEKIRYLRKQKRLTLEQVGEAVGVGKSTVRKWETGDIANMRRDKIAKIAEVLGVTPSYLMGWEDENGNPIQRNNMPANAMQISTRVIPLAGVVGAGECIDFGKESTMESVYAVKGDYALEVGGDSMEPTIMRGDIITVSLSAEIRDGDIAVVQIDDGATIKRVTHLPDGSLLLISDNGHYPPRVVLAASNENCHVQGRVMSIVKEV